MTWWSDFVAWAGWSWPAWNAFTAVGTIGAVVVSLWLAGREMLRRSREEVRQQAEAVTAWIEGDAEVVDGHLIAKLVIQNASHQLAYRLVASMVRVRGAGDGAKDGDYRLRAFAGEVPPGTSEYRIEVPGAALGSRAAVEIAFQDAAGRYWRRQPNGVLRKTDRDPLANYGLHEPVPWLPPDSHFMRPA